MFPVQHIMFRNITEKEYRDMELCRGMRTAEYEKDCVLFHAGDYTEEFGIVIFGKVHIENICTVCPQTTLLAKHTLSATFLCW